MKSQEGSDRQESTHAAAGWLALTANFAYATVIYYGMAPPPGGLPTDWWHGRTFILDMESMGGYVDDPAMGALLVVIPAAVLSVGVFAATRSALARAMALGITISAMIFALVGFAAAFAWEQFSWRMTAVALSSGMALGFAIVAPLLAKSWLRLSGIVRAVLYLPIFFGLMAAVRGATGTSEHMAFLVSPWPIFASFALGSGVVFITGFLFSMSLGVLSLSRGIRGFPALAGFLVAVVIPSIWFDRGVTELTPGIFLSLSAVTAVLIFAATHYRGGGDKVLALQSRSFLLGLGATLAFVPVFSGLVLASGDYVVNRYILGPSVANALQDHIATSDSYPEDLGGLVEAGYFDELPRPRIGFAFLSGLGLADEVKYRYNEYGSSFILEFDSNLWIQCSYSGQFYYDDEEEEDYEDEEDESGWSCLGKAPSLIDESPGDEDDDDYDDYEDDYDDDDYEDDES